MRYLIQREHGDPEAGPASRKRRSRGSGAAAQNVPMGSRMENKLVSTPTLGPESEEA